MSDRSDEWVDIESGESLRSLDQQTELIEMPADDEYEERNLTKHVHFVRSSVRASNKRAAKFSRMGSARLGEGWNRAVRDVCVTDIEDQMDDQYHDDSIYEVIKPIESESDFEVGITFISHSL